MQGTANFGAQILSFTDKYNIKIEKLINNNLRTCCKLSTSTSIATMRAITRQYQFKTTNFKLKSVYLLQLLHMKQIRNNAKQLLLGFEEIGEKIPLEKEVRKQLEFYGLNFENV